MTDVLATDPDRLRFRAPPGASSLVRGTYPRVESVCRDPEQPTLTARYPGTLEIRRDAGGTMSLTVTLSFQDYLEGIAEIPPSWPVEALEAQAVAARTYALASTGWSGLQGATLDTPICSTSACQVYRGVPVEPVPGIRRWYRAVRRTEGRVLLSAGRPAETLYFSTSNGRIYGNDEVFGSSPLPYLRPGVERDDGASPLSRWSTAIPLRELRTYLARAGLWPARQSISGVQGNGSSVAVTGPGGTRTVDGSAFREAVNTWAPCLRPARYPSGGLPVTLPSRWMTVRSSGRTAVVEGRGWGHGVGMVQWGAYGKARRGLSSEQILASYYGGLRPAPYPEPGLIHVEVASGLTRLRILATGGATLDGGELIPGVVTITGGDELTATGPRTPGP
ncbi:MAG: SpoIID/LytB domain-containing protein [Actinomycetota bacterium]